MVLKVAPVEGAIIKERGLNEIDVRLAIMGES